jgi:very-short-patch-repair endonuclease
MRFTKRDIERLKLWYFANQNALVLEEEYCFAQPERNFRFDWAFPSLKIAIEYEGGLLDHRSGHRSVKGVNKDVTKYNLAQQKGWKVLRFTAENYTTLIPELNKLIT